MFDLLEILNFESPESPRYGESTAEVIGNRPNDLWDSVEAIGRAASAMLGGVQERVENLAHHYDAVLDPSIVALSRSAADIRNEEIIQQLALGNDLDFNPGAPQNTQQIVAKNDHTASVLKYTDNEFSVDGARRNLTGVLDGTKVAFEPLPTEPMKSVDSQREYTPEEQQKINELRAQLAQLEAKPMQASNDEFALAA